MSFWKRLIRQDDRSHRDFTRPRGPSRKRRLQLESLEGRALLSTYTLSESYLFGFPMVTETVNNTTTNYFNPTSPFAVNTGSGTNTVNILNTSANIAINESGSGTDTINIGNGGSVQGILAAVSLQNPPSYNTININDSADTTARTVTLSNYSLGGANWGAISGLSTATIYYKYADTSSVNINTGSAADTVNVLATGVTTNISNDGYDVVNVGNGGSVQGILGTLTLQDPPHFNTVNVNDWADATARTVTLNTYSSGGSNWGSITGLAPAAIDYKYFDTSGVNITTGFGDDTVNVLATGVSTYLYSDIEIPIIPYQDTVNVGSGGSAQGILGTLYVEASPYLALPYLVPEPTTVLNIDDAADAAARTVTLGTDTPPGDTAWGTVIGLAPATINYRYSGTRGVNLTTGSGDDTVNVVATGVPTDISNDGWADVVNVGNGSYVQGILGTLTLQDPPGYNTVNVNDSADATARTVTLNTYSSGGSNWGSITGLAPAAIDYKYFDTSSVHLTTGHGAATVNVQATGVPTYLSSNGGADTVNVGAGGSVQGILGALYVENPPWYTTLNINDSADTAVRNASLSTITPGFDPVPWGSITGLAPAAINFAWGDVNNPVNIWTSPGAVGWYVALNAVVGDNGAVGVYDNGNLINGYRSP
jgi:hypothetical protein